MTPPASRYERTPPDATQKQAQAPSSALEPSQEPPTNYRPSAPSAPCCSTEPDPVSAARCVVRGVAPPSHLWDYHLPHLAEQQSIRGEFEPSDLPWDLFLTPESRCEVSVLEDLAPYFNNLSHAQEVLCDQPEGRLQLLKLALDECLKTLTGLVLGSGAGVNRSEYFNDRLVARLAQGCHQELRQLLAEWDQLNPPKSQERLTLDQVDRFFLDLAGRLGIHPSELAWLRYGEGDFLGLREVEQVLLRNLAPANNIIVLEQVLRNLGMITDEEAGWLERSRRATRFPITSYYGEQPPRFRYSEDDKATDISQLQLVGRNCNWGLEAYKQTEIQAVDALDLTDGPHR